LWVIHVVLCADNAVGAVAGVSEVSRKHDTRDTDVVEKELI
jgi:hypothetical protein